MDLTVGRRVSPRTKSYNAYKVSYRRDGKNYASFTWTKPEAEDLAYDLKHISRRKVLGISPVTLREV
ncbi:MAG: hypothetical protein BAJALOKI3v1_50053 [Promethearchaeota archaeon]|nr:MAG: hypothetical protein BAJALOKI3v1_50053 [Candidatus Lokiarchaeota archaeon]